MNKTKQHTIIHDGKKITGSGKVYTFAYLHRGSKHFFKMAEKNDVGQAYYLMSAMIYCAFTLEALIHHIGELKMGTDWKQHEYKCFKDKLKVLNNEYCWGIDLGKLPFQTSSSIFSYRKDIVHGKTEINIAPTINPEMKLPVDFESKWMLQTNFETAKTYIEDTNQMMARLIKLTNHRELIPGQMGISEYSTTTIENVGGNTK